MRDEDGHYQITGRVDDVINVKGHRIGTAELESCMVSEWRHSLIPNPIPSHLMLQKLTMKCWEHGWNESALFGVKHLKGGNRAGNEAMSPFLSYISNVCNMNGS